MDSFVADQQTETATKDSFVADSFVPDASSDSFVEDQPSFADKAKTMLASAVNAVSQEAHRFQQAQEQAMNPHNWSSSKFKKESPPPQTPQDQATFDAILATKKQQEEDMAHRIAPNAFPVKDSINFRDKFLNIVNQGVAQPAETTYGGVLKAAASTAKALEFYSNKIADGLGRPHTQESIFNILANDWDKHGDELLKNGVTQPILKSIYAGLGNLGWQLPQFETAMKLLGPGGFAAVGAFQGGPGGIKNAANEAVKGALTQGVLGSVSGLPRAIQASVVGGTMAGQTALEGGQSPEVIASGILGGGLGALGHVNDAQKRVDLKNFKFASETTDIRDALDQFKKDNPGVEPSLFVVTNADGTHHIEIHGPDTEPVINQQQSNDVNVAQPEGISQSDLTDLGAVPVETASNAEVLPEASKAKVLKSAIISLSPEDRFAAEGARIDVNAGEPGKRMKIAPDEGLDNQGSIGWGSSYPDWFKNRGWTQESVLKVIDNVLAGKKLVPSQQRHFADVLNAYKDHNKMLEDKYVRQQAKLEAEARRIGISEQDIEKSRTDNEAAALDQAKTEGYGEVDFQFGENAPTETTPLGEKQSLIPGTEGRSMPERGLSTEVPQKDTSLDFNAPQDNQTSFLAPEEKSGEMHAGLGIPKEEVQAVADVLKESEQDIHNLISPATVSSPAELTSQITRENLGKMARSHDMAEHSLKSASKMFAKQPNDANVDFIDKMEKGQPQANPQLDSVAKTLRDLLDKKREEVQALGTGKLDSFIENYFPHIWEQVDEARNIQNKIGVKRPLEGAKSFLKKRTIESTADGIAAGLTPVSYNPVDLALIKIREMDRYLMAHRTINALKENGLAKFVPIGKDVPEGWTKLDDRISTVYKSPMIPIQEAIDSAVMGGLEKVADSLGIKRERQPHIGGTRLGYAQQGPIDVKTGMPGPGNVMTKFATPEEVLAHEIGHQIDYMYGVKKKMFGGSRPMVDFIYDKMIAKAQREGRVADVAKFEKQKVVNRELRALAEATEGPKHWRTKSTEKMAVMIESLVHAPKAFQRIAPTAFQMITDIIKGDERLKPILDIEPNIARSEVRSSEVYAGGLVISGHVYAQPDAARLINNYLSPSLSKFAAFRLFRGAGNALNQFQLGLSAYHAGFTSIETMVSKLDIAIRQMFSGHPIEAIKAALSVPIAPISNVLRGSKVYDAWFNGKGQTSLESITADMMASAGGKARMDQFYATNMVETLKKAFKDGRPIKGLLSLPFAAIDIASKPILQWLVPRQKLGIFADMMKLELQRNPDMTHEQMRIVAQKAWDSVDNRMGQMVYDNLFWNKTLKDVLMANVRSVGWNLGSIRLVTGAIKDFPKLPGDLKAGRQNDFTYVASTVIMVGILGAIYSYLRTGKGPEELKDYYFPKNGGTDANGDPSRDSLPSYMKDAYHYLRAPVRTLTNKLNPLDAAIYQMLTNKDYYGTKIRNEDNPFVKQIKDETEYVLKQFIPFGVRNVQKTAEAGKTDLASKVLPFVGITPAPYDLNMTQAEEKIHEINQAKLPQAGRTQEAADKSKLKHQILTQLRSKDPVVFKSGVDALRSAFVAGQFSKKDKADLLANRKIEPLQQQVKSMTAEELQKVVDLATPEEKAKLAPILQKKLMNSRKNNPYKAIK